MFGIEPKSCDCCGTESSEIAIDSSAGLCLYCQPCPYCGRMGTACDSDRGPSCCDTVDYENRPRRDADEVMAEIAESYQARLASEKISRR